MYDFDPRKIAPPWSFSKSKTKDMDKDKQIKELQELVDRYRSQNMKMEKKIESLVKFEDVKFIFDFEKKDVFSIERIVTESEEATIIAWMENGANQEWYFHCTREQHNKLVEEYEKVRNK